MLRPKYRTKKSLPSRNVDVERLRYVYENHPKYFADTLKRVRLERESKNLCVKECLQTVAPSIVSDGYYKSKQNEVILPIIKLAPHQEEFYVAAHNEKYKRFFILWHRRAGKDLLCFLLLVSECVKRNGIACWFVFPYLVQAKKAVWASTLDDGTRLLDAIPEHIMESINNQELKITFRNGSSISFVDASSKVKSRGSGLHWIVYSEYAFMKPENISPIKYTTARDPNSTSDPNDGKTKEHKVGKIIFNTTPNRKNHAYELYCKMLEDENSFVSKKTVDDTNVVSADVLATFEREDPPEMVAQELRCSFESGGEGYYYTSALDMVEDRGDLGQGSYFEHDPSGLVFTSWDLGITDHTSVIFFQIQYEKRDAGQKKYWLKIIDCYQDSNQRLSFYMKYLGIMENEKGYTYGSHFVPKDFSSRAMYGSYWAEANEVGFSPIVLEYSYSLMEGINLGRSTLGRCTFARDQTQELRGSLGSYRKEYDSVRLQYRNRPRHDEFSDFADSFRYLSIVYNDYYNNIERKDFEYRNRMKNRRERYSDSVMGELFGSVKK